MGNIFEDLLTQAATDDRLNPVEFRLFYTIVQVYRDTPEECDMSQRAWAARSHTAPGGIGEIQRHLEELGYISITPTHFDNLKRVAIAVLSQGRPITSENRSKGKEWKWRSSYLLPQNAQQPNRWRVVIQEYTDVDEADITGWNERSSRGSDTPIQDLAV